VTKAAVPIMRALRSGHLIQVSSISGVNAYPGLGVYNATKWALEGLNQSCGRRAPEPREGRDEGRDPPFRSGTVAAFPY
jgi:NADP-dependent 3-hydroxy acid dehydrogenase YdfG